MTDKNRVMIYIDDELKEELQKTAKEENRSMSNLIAYIIKKYLEEKKNEN